jgi:hypothetical protein
MLRTIILTVLMELLYYNLSGIASRLSVSITGPTKNQEKLAKLFENYLSIKYFHQAR